MGIQANGNDQPLRDILVATDFSAGALVALECAIEIAKLHEASIHLLHAVDVRRSIPLKIEEQVRSQLAKLKVVAQTSGVAAETIYRAGNSWEVVAAVEKLVKPDLVVVGTRGHNPWSRAYLGSQADRIIRVAETPVLAVHPDDAGSIYTLENVVVGIDFSEESLLATNLLIRLIRHSPWDVRIVLVHAFHVPLDYTIGDGGAVSTISPAVDESQATIHLESIADSIRRGGLRVETRAIYGYPVAVIEEEAKRCKADLVVVGTHGRTGLQRMFLGSVAERVIHHAQCPVMAVRQPRTTVTAPAEQASAAVGRT